VHEAGVRFHTLHGRAITAEDWDFFYRCYERTYLEHDNAPYLSRTFFAASGCHPAGKLAHVYRVKA
jgi:predicted N-acyltransferase